MYLRLVQFTAFAQTSSLSKLWEITVLRLTIFIVFIATFTISLPRTRPNAEQLTEGLRPNRPSVDLIKSESKFVYFVLVFRPCSSAIPHLPLAKTRRCLRSKQQYINPRVEQQMKDFINAACLSSFSYYAHRMHFTNFSSFRILVLLY